VRFLSTLANLDDSWFIFYDFAHRFTPDMPYLSQFRNSVVPLGENLIIVEARAICHVPEVSCILNLLAVG
jgi:hypothetical protein